VLVLATLLARPPAPAPPPPVPVALDPDEEHASPSATPTPVKKAIRKDVASIRPPCR
jgi:hypothetical protein